MRPLTLEAAHRALGARLGEAEGARVVTDYGDPAGEARAARAARPVAVDLSHRGRIAVTGPDRVELLHGQSSNHVRGLAPGSGNLACFLTGKGRLVAWAALHVLPDRILLECDGEALEPLLAHLRSYLIMEDARVEDLSPATVQLGLLGPDAERVLAAAAAALGDPGPDRAVLTERLGPWPGASLLVPAAEAADLFARLVAVKAHPRVGRDALETRRIEDGRPRFGAEADDATFPPELGLDPLLAFDKGCYTGYEVMARIKTYGHVNRALVGLLPAEPVAPGAAVVASPGDRPLGRVTSAAWSPHLERPIALAVLRRESALPGTRLGVAGVGAGAGAEVAAEVAALPFVPQETPP